MTTMREACEAARGRLQGALPPDLSILDGPYVPGTGEINLLVPKPKAQPGALVSVGLNTFIVTAVGTGGSTFSVVPIDGVDVACPPGERVYFRSAFSTKMIFDQVKNEVLSLSSPINGLYRPVAVEFPTNHYDQVYPVPSDWTTDPLRVLRIEALVYGHSAMWVQVGRFEWQASQGIVRIIDECSDFGSTVRVTFAMPFVGPANLDSTFEEVGVPYWMEDIPILGACANLAVGLDGRRANPSAQGDTRRASELSQSAGANLANVFITQKRLRLREEYARLVSQYPPRMVT